MSNFQELPELQPGDIILCRRKPYKGPFKYFLTRIILFFTTEWWTGEKTSKHYHAEMIYLPMNKFSDKSLTIVLAKYSHLFTEKTLVISQDWPKVRIKSLGSLNNKEIWRLSEKPEDFNEKFFKYCEEKIGQKYDWLKFISFGFYWLFLGSRIGLWINKKLGLKHKDVCSEFVANFYESIGNRASVKPASATSPDDIYDYISSSPKWEKVL